MPDEVSIMSATLTASDVLLDTSAAGGADTCFANPSTSEFDLVKSLDRSDIRTILCLSEGVLAGAADGYGRMRGVTALTLTNLGPRFAGAIQNLHNAKRQEPGHQPDWPAFHRTFYALTTSG